MTDEPNRQEVSASNSAGQPRTRASLGLRWISALVLAPIAVLLTWWGGGFLHVMIAILAVLMAFEWNRLIFGSSGKWYFIIHALISVTAIGLLHFELLQASLLATLLGAIGIFIVSFILNRSLFWPCLGVVYTTLPCLGFAWIRSQPELGLGVAISLLFVVWATDTGAYFFGRTIGGPKLVPRLSPSKTWAGLVGAVCWACVFAGGAAYIWGARPIVLFAVIGAVLGLLAQVGDIAESAVKRHFNAKDTSGFIPGHGGVLDRLDGLMFAVLAVSLIMLSGSL